MSSLHRREFIDFFVPFVFFVVHLYFSVLSAYSVVYVVISTVVEKFVRCFDYAQHGSYTFCVFRGEKIKLR